MCTKNHIVAAVPSVLKTAIMKMRARTNRVTSAQHESSGIMRRFIQDDTSGGELLVFINEGGTSFILSEGV
jgi:hypothetical protein